MSSRIRVRDRCRAAHVPSRWLAVVPLAVALATACSREPRSFAELQQAAAHLAADEQTTVLERFVDRRNGPPILDGATATFLARGESDRPPRILGDFNAWGYRAPDQPDAAIGAMTRFGETSWFFLQVELDPSARVEYLVAYGPDDYQLDPLNRRRTLHGPETSELVGPGYEPPTDLRDSAPAGRGSTVEYDLPSRALAGPRHVILYTPPGYDAARRYPLVIFQDGSLLVEAGQTPDLLDGLIGAGRMTPVVAVFVDPLSRSADYAPSRAFLEFSTRELLPWIDSRRSIVADPHRRAVIGISKGASAALALAWEHNDLFGLCGLLIPAIRPGTVPEEIAGSPRRDLRFVMVAGLYDAFLLPEAHELRDALASRAYAVEYREVPEGHATETWRSHLAEVLVSLLPMVGP